MTTTGYFRSHLQSLEGYVEYQMTWEEFKLAQELLSGCSFGPTEEDTLQFLKARDEELETEASEYEEQIGYYHLPMGYCSYGLEEKDGTRYLAWYETTSGTLVLHVFKNSEYYILVPEERVEGFHDKTCQMIKKGLTKELHEKSKQYLQDDALLGYEKFWAWYSNCGVDAGYSSPQELRNERTARKEALALEISQYDDYDYDEEIEDYDYDFDD